MSGTCIITTNVCVPVWQCEPGQTGYEIDGCGNRRANPVCNPLPTGNVSFSSTPQGAEIYIDGADQNLKTPATISGIPAGDHTYTLRQAGYNDVTGVVNVGANQTAAASATLTPAAKPGTGMGTIITLGLLGALGAVILRSGKQTTIVARGGP